jgi:hypothetical protein
VALRATSGVAPNPAKRGPTGVRRETASGLPKVSRGSGVTARVGTPAKPAIGVTTDFGQPISPPTTQQDRATECLRAVPRTDRAGTRSWSECHGHLAGLGFRLRLSPRLPDREALCSQAARISRRHKPWGPSSPPSEKRPRSIMGQVRWYVTRQAASIAERDCCVGSTAFLPRSG